MFKNAIPLAVDLAKVPPAQRSAIPRSESKDELKRVAHFQEFVKDATSGVQRILTGPRAQLFTEEQQKDLLACSKLLTSNSELPFDWNINLYTNPPELKSRRLPTDKMQPQLGDKPYDEPEDDEDLDYDLLERPHVNKHDVHLIRLSNAPYWALVLYFSI